jgi:hypothetical protein
LLSSDKKRILLSRDKKRILLSSDKKRILLSRDKKMDGCKFCRKSAAKYSCPRCNAAYCSLPCYQVTTSGDSFFLFIFWHTLTFYLKLKY